MKYLIFGLLASIMTASADMLFEKQRIEVTVEPDAKEIIVEYPFTVDGNGAELINYDAPCSCLSARIEPLNADRSTRLKWGAGESGKVMGKFELGNFKGTVEKAILLNLKDQQPVQLIVEVTIPDLVSITPSTQRWDQGGKTDTKVYSIKVSGKDPVKITGTRGTNDDFPYELITKKPGWEYEIHVSPKDSSTPKLGMIRIKTDSKFSRFKKLQLFAVVQAPR